MACCEVDSVGKKQKRQQPHRNTSEQTFLSNFVYNTSIYLLSLREALVYKHMYIYTYSPILLCMYIYIYIHTYKSSLIKFSESKQISYSLYYEYDFTKVKNVFHSIQRSECSIYLKAIKLLRIFPSCIIDRPNTIQIYKLKLKCKMISIFYLKSFMTLKSIHIEAKVMKQRNLVVKIKLHSVT